jgi:hypothetical protein
MRVLLVHALPLDHRGGAEISLRQHLQQAPAGVTVDTILPPEAVDLNRYQVVILANLRPAALRSSGGVSTAKRRLWEWMNRCGLQGVALRSEIAWAKLWRRRLAGYRGYVIKSERDVHPCVYRDGRCLELKPLRVVDCGATKTVARAFQRLYNFCDAVQFLSPLHRRAINAIVNIDVPQYEIAPPVDLSVFRNYTPLEQRKQAALLTGDAIREAPTAERRAREAGYAVERIEYLSLPHERMPEVLNQYCAVVVDPVMLHAFGRLAVEALACGCRLLASERVGALSWPDPLAACRESNSRFWEMVTTIPARPNPRRLGGSESPAGPRRGKANSQQGGLWPR